MRKFFSAISSSEPKVQLTVGILVFVGLFISGYFGWLASGRSTLLAINATITAESRLAAQTAQSPLFPSITPTMVVTAETIPTISPTTLTISPTETFDSLTSETQHIYINDLDTYWDGLEENSGIGTQIREIVDGIYKWDLNVHEIVKLYAKSTYPPLADPVIEITATFEKIQGPSNVAYGLAFNMNDSNTIYDFLVRNAQYSFWINEEGQKTAFNPPWTDRPFINVTGKNTLKIVFSNNQTTLYINDNFVGSYNLDLAVNGLDTTSLRLVVAVLPDAIDQPITLELSHFQLYGHN